MAAIFSKLELGKDVLGDAATDVIAVVAGGEIVVGTGGVHCSGSAEVVVIPATTAILGELWLGAALLGQGIPEQNANTWLGSGGVECGGSAAVYLSDRYIATGGIVCGSSAKVVLSKVKSKPISIYPRPQLIRDNNSLGVTFGIFPNLPKNKTKYVKVYCTFNNMPINRTWYSEKDIMAIVEEVDMKAMRSPTIKLASSQIKQKTPKIMLESINGQINYS